MPVVMTVKELERFLLAEFPQVFQSGSGLAIEVGSAAAGCDRHSGSFRCGRAERFPAQP
jgi:hypothetical protein